jgi:hypothetical protein
LVNSKWFQGLEGQQIPDMRMKLYLKIYKLYEKILGEKFVRPISNINERIEKMFWHI